MHRRPFEATSCLPYRHQTAVPDRYAEIPTAEFQRHILRPLACALVTRLPYSEDMIMGSDNLPKQSASPAANDCPARILIVSEVRFVRESLAELLGRDN